MRLSTSIKLGKRTLGAATILFSVLFLSSCLKNDDTDYTPAQSNVLIVNAYPASSEDGVIFGYNGYYVDKDQPIAYGDYSRYYRGLYAGFTLSFFRASSPQTVLAEGGSPGENLNWSVFFTGKRLNDGGDSTFAIKDKFEKPAGGKANIRFVNASKSLGDLDFTVGTEKASAVKFGTATDFKTYNADGSTAMDVAVAAVGGTTNLATLNFTPKSGNTYTVYVFGLKTETGAKRVQLKFIDHEAAYAESESAGQ